MVKLTLDERLSRALDMRRAGANCSRCVAMAFPDVTDSTVEAEQLGKMAEGLGGGVGGCGLTCGAITSMVLVDGIARPQGLGKAAVYGRAAALTRAFEEQNGATECRRLKGELKRDCTSLILNAVTLLHNSLAEE